MKELKNRHTKFSELDSQLEKDHPEEMAEARIWAKDFIERWKEDPSLIEIGDWSIELAKNQETLPAEFQQILVDNSRELYEKEYDWYCWEEQDFMENRVMYENGLEHLEELPTKEKHR